MKYNIFLSHDSSVFFYRILGINILIPVLDKVKYVQSLKEIAIDIPQQTAISSGNMSFFYY